MNENNVSRKRRIYKSIFSILFVVLVAFIAFWAGWIAQQELNEQENEILNDVPEMTEPINEEKSEEESNANTVSSTIDNDPCSESSIYSEISASGIEWYSEPQEYIFSWFNGEDFEDVQGCKLLAFRGEGINLGDDFSINTINDYLKSSKNWTSDTANQFGGDSGNYVIGFTNTDNKRLILQGNVEGDLPPRNNTYDRMFGVYFEL